jgi:hypothetical protein
MLQRAADTLLGDWFEYIVGPPVMDLTAAPYGGARYPVEARMDARTLPDSTWMPELEMWSSSRMKQSNVGTGWNSLVSPRQPFA